MKAIHDRYYQTPPLTFNEFRWRLQHIAEEKIGGPLRRSNVREDMAASELLRRVDGTR